jgi:hypothetical protein
VAVILKDIHCAPITHVDESGLFFPKIIQRPQTPPVQIEQAYAMTTIYSHKYLFSSISFSRPVQETRQ